jgi:hypothetical protein
VAPTQKKVEKKPKIPKRYYWLLGGIVAIILVAIFWPKSRTLPMLTAANFNSIRPEMAKADVVKYVGRPPGDYRTTNKGAAPRFDPPASGTEHDIWETNFGGYCVVYNSSGKVIRVDRKPPL